MTIISDREMAAKALVLLTEIAIHEDVTPDQIKQIDALVLEYQAHIAQPVEPTEAMVDAGFEAALLSSFHPTGKDRIRLVLAAAMKAAP